MMKREKIRTYTVSYMIYKALVPPNDHTHIFNPFTGIAPKSSMDIVSFKSV